MRTRKRPTVALGTVGTLSNYTAPVVTSRVAADSPLRAVLRVVGMGNRRGASLSPPGFVRPHGMASLVDVTGGSMPSGIRVVKRFSARRAQGGATFCVRASCGLGGDGWAWRPTTCLAAPIQKWGLHPTSGSWTRRRSTNCARRRRTSGRRRTTQPRFLGVALDSIGHAVYR